jgi:hypothetical protein
MYAGNGTIFFGYFRKIYSPRLFEYFLTILILVFWFCHPFANRNWSWSLFRLFRKFGHFKDTIP